MTRNEGLNIYRLTLLRFPIRVSMAKFVHADVVDQILLRSEVKDLIRFKSVCKSWHSLITSPRFVNRHLNHSYNKDCCNNKLNNRRICLAYEECFYSLVGSCNGLVCIFSYLTWTILVGNPMTREVRRLNLPSFLLFRSLCWGFGHDLSEDDYTVVVADKKGENQTCFYLLSLKSNVWRVIGEVKYRLLTKAGILCNGALHWLVGDNENTKKLIICYDLSKEEFKEIPLLPDDARYMKVLLIATWELWKNVYAYFGGL
ncbi:putative F-box domain, galactose oxidase/kelch, beta-propeller, F-box associated interaction [Helianthus annuus]|nr:putative F-box domain, galactose oxidase/kelch, beta-propeller, F-box associated interaction [Helianthus annuus]